MDRLNNVGVSSRSRAVVIKVPIPATEDRVFTNEVQNYDQIEPRFYWPTSWTYVSLSLRQPMVQCDPSSEHRW